MNPTPTLQKITIIFFGACAFYKLMTSLCCLPIFDYPDRHFKKIDIERETKWLKYFGPESESDPSEEEKTDPHS